MSRPQGYLYRSYYDRLGGNLVEVRVSVNAEALPVAPGAPGVAQPPKRGRRRVLCPRCHAEPHGMAMCGRCNGLGYL